MAAPLVGLTVQLMQQCFGSFYPWPGPADLKLVATITDVYIQAILKVLQILVERTTQSAETLGIVGFENDSASECDDAPVLRSRLGVILLFHC